MPASTSSGPAPHPAGGLNGMTCFMISTVCRRGRCSRGAGPRDRFGTRTTIRQSVVRSAAYRSGSRRIERARSQATLIMGRRRSWREDAGRVLDAGASNSRDASGQLVPVQYGSSLANAVVLVELTPPDGLDAATWTNEVNAVFSA